MNNELVFIESDTMAVVYEKVKAVLDNDVTVLLEGESGTGKELVARTIHFQGGRKEGPFVTVNCAAIPDALLESELFGYSRGSFTGAQQDKPGKFELADGGTLFLDEVGELPFLMQAKLLRVLQDKRVERLGSNQTKKIDVRIVAATNKRLQQEVYAGKFREDLFYRLAVFPIFLPPLRQRGKDVFSLAENFLAEENRQGKKKFKGFTERAKEMIYSYSWPGNIRELQNVIKRAYILCNGSYIDAQHLSFLSLLGSTKGNQPIAPEPSLLSGDSDNLETLQEIEHKLIQQRVDYFDGNISKAATSLGITRATVYSKLQLRNKRKADK